VIETLLVLYFEIGVGYGLHKLIRIYKAGLRSGHDYMDWVLQIVGWPFAVWLEYEAKE
jgi:hypothetical protein